MGIWNDSLLFFESKERFGVILDGDIVFAVGTQDLKLVHADLKEAMVEAQDPQL